MSTARQQSGKVWNRRENPPVAAQPAPTRESNLVLAEFDRAKPGSIEVLRLSVGEFQGKLVLGLRHWYRSFNREWCPTTKGCTIRVNEIDRLIDALQKAKVVLLASAADRPQRPVSSQRFEPRSASRGPSTIVDPPF